MSEDKSTIHRIQLMNLHHALFVSIQAFAFMACTPHISPLRKAYLNPIQDQDAEELCS